MEPTKQRIEKGNTSKITDRIKYLRSIINREIPLKKGQMEWLSKPCDIRDNVKNSGGKYKYIGKGAYGTVFNVCIDKLCNYEFVLKEIKYNNDVNFLDNDNPYRAENVEVKIFKLLNDLVYIGATPHIPLYLGDFVCDIDNEHYRYLMVEKADTNLKTVLKFNNSDDDLYRNVLFQILYTLKIIQKRYPGFIHNDLKPDNILVFNPNPINDGMYYKYTLDGTVYYVPNNYRTALWDFGISSIICKQCDNILVEDLVLHQTIGVQTEQNHYKDIFKLFEYLKMYYSLEPETKEFVNKYVNHFEFTDEYLNLIPNIEPFNIEEMLADSYFDKYRSNNIPNNKIIEDFSDESVNDMSLANFGGISEISTELIFDCKSYNDKIISYYEYKLPRYNDPYRVNCLSSIHSDILNSNDTDYLAVVSGYYGYHGIYGTKKNEKDMEKDITYEQYTEQILTIGDDFIENFSDISIEDKEKIVKLFTNLITKFVNYTYVTAENRKMSNLLRLVVLSKSVFIITNIHHPVDVRRESKYLDYVVQFNMFLCHNL